jgi:peptidylprolyl isomerase domain and WD repeat-containing protein 1
MASNGSESPSKSKRSRAEMEADDHPMAPAAQTADDSSSDEDDFGPALPSSAPKKKKRKLPYEKLYIAALPTAQRYSKSLMHREQLCFTTLTPHTDFLITSSIDGVVKFWKKDFGGVEFVKEFKAHTGEIRNVSASADGRSFATTGESGV